MVNWSPAPMEGLVPGLLASEEQTIGDNAWNQAQVDRRVSTRASTVIVLP